MQRLKRKFAELACIKTALYQNYDFAFKLNLKPTWLLKVKKLYLPQIDFFPHTEYS